MIDRLARASMALGVRETAVKVVRLLVSVAGICTLAYILSTLVLRTDVYFVVLAAVVVAASIILSRRFELGIFLFLLIAPFNTGTSPAVLGEEASYNAGIMPSQASLAFLCFYWLVSGMLGSGFRIERTRLNGPLYVFFGLAIASMVMSFFVWDPEVQRYKQQILYPVSEIGLWILCAAAFFMTASKMRNQSWLKALFWPVVIVALYAAVFQITDLEMIWSISRSTFTVAFAATVVMARLFFGRDSSSVKVGLALLLGVFLTAILWNTAWVSGLISAILGIAFVLLLYSRKVFAVVAVACLILLLAQPGALHSIYHESRSQGDMDRLNMWGDAARMASSTNPLFGIGPASYLAYSRKFGSVWYGHTTYTTAHSDYAQIIAEMGLLGILSFVWLVIVGAKVGLEAIRKTPADLKWLSVAGTSVFAAIAVTSLVGDYLFPSRVNGGIWSFGTSVIPWVLLGAAVAASRVGDNPLSIEEQNR